MFDVGEAAAGGVLNAPSSARSRPFDLGPHAAADREVIGFGVHAANLDHAVASFICHFFSLFLASWGFKVSKCPNPNSHAGFWHFLKCPNRVLWDTLKSASCPRAMGIMDTWTLWPG